MGLGLHDARLYVPYEWPKFNGERVPWEICQTLDAWSFGYHRDDEAWKSVRQLVVMLAETVSKEAISCWT